MSMTNEEIAKIAHEVNRAYCQALGDTSPLPWDEAPDGQKQSVLDGVRFHMEHPHAGPEASHANWVAQKLAEEWRRGDVKDEARKLHPCLVPFVDLPIAQQAKDYIFHAIVHQLMPTPAETPIEAPAAPEAAPVPPETVSSEPIAQAAPGEPVSPEAAQGEPTAAAEPAPETSGQPA